MVCHGKCLYFNKEIISKKTEAHSSRYEKHDSKYCRLCEVYLSYENVRCPCCSARLRYKPRQKINRQICNETRNIFTEGF